MTQKELETELAEIQDLVKTEFDRLRKANELLTLERDLWKKRAMKLADELGLEYKDQ